MFNPRAAGGVGGRETHPPAEGQCEDSPHGAKPSPGGGAVAVQAFGFLETAHDFISTTVGRTGSTWADSIR